MSAKGPDQVITQQLTLKLANSGIRSPCQVTVAARNGDVTLTGTVQYPHQKVAAMRAASGIQGVRRVTDQMTVKPIKRT